MLTKIVMELVFHPYRIRPFEKGDDEPLVRYGNNPNVAINLRDSFPSPYRKIDALEWLKVVRQQDPPANFAIATKEELIGGIGLRFFSDVYRLGAEVGYWLGEPFWGKGIATTALRVFSKYAFENFVIERLWAGVFEDNARSCRVLEKAGFQREGVLRKAIVKEEVLKDEVVYSLLRSEMSNLLSSPEAARNSRRE